MHSKPEWMLAATVHAIETATAGGCRPSSVCSHAYDTAPVHIRQSAGMAIGLPGHYLVP